MDFKGKVALVTGSSRGIGRATALRLAAGGADLIVHYRQNEAPAREVVGEIEALGRKAMALRADLEKPSEIRRLFQGIKESFGRLDIFVANAAATAFRDLLAVKEHNITRTYQLNVADFIISVQEAVPLMAGCQGRIVAISSFPTHRYMPGYGTLASAKAALESLVIYLACELAGRGINVNCVSPGLVRTDSARIYGGDDNDEFERSLIAATPKGRAATPEEIANVIAFLCSAEAEWVTGQTLLADGGLLLTAPYFRRR